MHKKLCPFHYSGLRIIFGKVKASLERIVDKTHERKNYYQTYPPNVYFEGNSSATDA